MSMNRLTKQTLMFVTGFILLFFILGIAGNADLTEQIVYTMPQEAYEEIYLKLGNGCTDSQIAKEYLSNKSYYDSIK